MEDKDLMEILAKYFFEKYPDKNINACITNTLIVMYTHPANESCGNPPPKYRDEYKLPDIFVKCDIGMESISSPLNVSNI